MNAPLIASLGRIADLAEVPWDVEALGQADWATGDYVVARVVGAPSALYHIEDCSGEMIDVREGRQVVGALGVRAATLEGVGSWREVEGGRLHALTSAGLFGTFTSMSALLPKPLTLDYVGHVRRGGRTVRMRDFAITGGGATFDVPVILIVGTSMSAGKTVTGALVCRLLAEAGLRVIGAKFTGAGRYRDILEYRKAGAFECYDFVDAGLPSTVVSEERFFAALRPLLGHIAARRPDYVVAEAGASPLEPYNGAALVAELGERVCCRILAASDPYAVVGVQQAFGFEPDLVTGPATNTTAAIELVGKLTGLPAINVLGDLADEAMKGFLETRLERPLAPRPAGARGRSTA